MHRFGLYLFIGSMGLFVLIGGVILMFRKKNKSGVTPNESDRQSGGQAAGFGIRSVVVSDVGCMRGNNEDNYLLSGYVNIHSTDHMEACFETSSPEGWCLAGVFDGMGGGEQGEVASRITAQLFGQCALSIRHKDRNDAVEAIRKAYLDANNRIIQLQQESKIYGTTGTVLCTDGEAFKIFHLGDSRAYLLRDGSLFRLTRDQTLAQMKIEVGIYEETDPQAELERHKLTEYIGRDWTRENLRPVETEWTPICKEDRLMLCSDGLYDMCAEDVVVKILRENKQADEAAQKLIQSAIEAGGEDNVTCIVLDFI